MFQYYNANPNGYIISDCVRRSLALVYNVDYKQVTRELRTIREHTNEKVSNVPIVFEEYIHRHGCIYESEPILKNKEQTITQFSRTNNIGIYILIVGIKRGQPKHMTVLKDGTLYDTFDCSSWYIIKYYKIQ